MPSEETKSQFDQLAFDANAAIDSLRPERPFPYPLKAARQLFMPLFVLAELRVGVARSKRREENAAAVDDLYHRCRLLIPDTNTVEFYASDVVISNACERFRSRSRSVKDSAMISGSQHSACNTRCRC